MSRAALEVLKKIKKLGPPPTSTMEILFVMSKGCSLYDRITSEVEEMDPGTHRVDCSTTQSLLPDAADMLICIEVMKSASRFDEICIVSNDRFASTFAAVATERKINVRNVTSLAELAGCLWV